MRIGELAKRVGLRASALRYYESRGILTPAGRVSGRREYGPDAENRLKLLLAAQDAGFSLRETRTLLALLSDERRGPELWREMARRKLEELEMAIEGLREAHRTLGGALACSCAGEADRCRLVSGRPVPRPRALRGARRLRRERP